MHGALGTVEMLPATWQEERLLELNEAVLKNPLVTRKAIRAAGDPPICPASNENGRFGAYLVASTGDPVETTYRNWLACRYVHEQLGHKVILSDRLVDDRMRDLDAEKRPPDDFRCHMAPREGAIPRSPGVRWVVVEFGHTYRGLSAVEALPKMLARGFVPLGEELPLIAALDPTWAWKEIDINHPMTEAPDLEWHRDGWFVDVPSIFVTQSGCKWLGLGCTLSSCSSERSGPGYIIE